MQMMWILSAMIMNSLLNRFLRKRNNLSKVIVNISMI